MTEEEPSLNKVVESLQVFTDVCNNKLLKKASMIVFLNKADLFEEKIKKSLIKNYFPEYTGRQELNDAKIFFKKKFQDIFQESEMKESSIFMHSTTNTDRLITKKIISMVEEVLLRGYAKSARLQ